MPDAPELFALLEPFEPLAPFAPLELFEPLAPFALLELLEPLALFAPLALLEPPALFALLAPLEPPALVALLPPLEPPELLPVDVAAAGFGPGVAGALTCGVLDAPSEATTGGAEAPPFVAAAAFTASTPCTRVTLSTFTFPAFVGTWSE